MITIKHFITNRFESESWEITSQKANGNSNSTEYIIRCKDLSSVTNEVVNDNQLNELMNLIAHVLNTPA